jgi:hypothetical protein
VKAIGIGINLLPHATRELAALGLEPALTRAAIDAALAASMLSRLAGGNAIAGQASSIDATLRTATIGGNLNGDRQ